MDVLLKQIADHHLLNGLFCKELGLWEGKMGMSLFFFLLSRHTGNHWYEEFAGELLEDVCGSLSQRCSVTFADGLCGIGWAIEFLKKEGFVEGDTDEILEEVDRQVMERDVRRITDASLETGLAGIAAYVRSRLDSERSIKNHHPFDSEYLSDLDVVCRKCHIPWMTPAYQTSPLWQTIWPMLPSSDVLSWQKGVMMLEQNVSNIKTSESDQLYSYERNRLYRQAESLSEEGHAMIRHANQPECMEAGKRRSYRKQGKQLCLRSLQLYGEALSISTRKCLLVFSQESTGSQYGIGTYIHQLIQCFDAMEWDVHVITLYVSEVQEVRFHLKDNAAWYDYPIPVERLSSNAPIHEDRYFRGISHLWASHVGDGRKVCCHFNFPGHQRLASLFKESLGASIAFTLHYTSWSFELLGDKELLTHFLQQPSNAIKDTFEMEKAFMQETCDRIIAIARHSYDMLRDTYGLPEEKLAYIPNGLKDEYCERTPKERSALRKKYHYAENEKIILFAGRLDRVKGITELITAFKGVFNVIPEARLIVAGSGNFTDSMKAASPYWRHISFTGFIPKEQLYELYAIADVGVLPSIHEEFGYVAAEMMLNKLPVVVHDTTGLREITDNGKYAVTFRFDENKNIIPLQEAILKALAGKHSEQQKEQARNRVLEHYTIPLFQECIKSVFTCMEKPCSIYINNSNNL